MMLQPDGKILISGRFTSVNGRTTNGLARLDAKGTVDPTFTPALVRPNILIQANGQIILWDSRQISRLNLDGSLDQNFTPPALSFPDLGGPLPAEIRCVGLAPDGKVYVGGAFSVDSTDRKHLIRLNSNGTLDPTLPNIPLVRANVPPFYSVGILAIVVQPDGKLLVGGSFTRIADVNRDAIARLNPDGSFDASLASPGIPPGQYVTDIFVQSTGKILLEGPISIVRPNRTYVDIIRLTVNGTLDETFTGPAVRLATKCALQSDDKLVCVWGQSNSSPPGSRLARRLNATDGFDDPTFSPPLVGNTPQALAIQPDGKILVGGNFTGFNGVYPERSLVRLNPDGSMDLPASIRTDFDGNLKADISVFRPSTGTWYHLLSPGLYTSQAWGQAGDVLVPADFDGDGKTDDAVFRPGEGAWYIINSRDLTFSRFNWGTSTDTPIAADYDGDRKADLMIFRSVEIAGFPPAWFVISSIDQAQVTTFYGERGDEPVRGDFDGDGRADLAVYTRFIGRWRSRFSSSIGTGNLEEIWGMPDDTPVPEDYDGDGKTDLTVYRPSTGTWYGSTGAVLTWGIPGDIPVPADYNGDGKVDRAVFRPSDRLWYLNLDGEWRIERFGEGSDVPVQKPY